MDIRITCDVGIAAQEEQKMLTSLHDLEGAERFWALLRLAFFQVLDYEKEKVLTMALEEAKKITQHDERAQALISLAPYLVGRERETALAALAAVSQLLSETDRAQALMELKPYLSNSLSSEAVKIAQKIEDENVRTWALAGFVRSLAESQLQTAIAAALKIQSRERRACAISKLAPHLAKLTCQTLFPIWQETLHARANHSRPDLLTDLQALVPVIIALGDAEAAVATCQAIQDIGRWWP